MSEKKAPQLRPIIGLPEGYRLVLRGETWDIEPPAGIDLQNGEVLATLTDLRRELEIAVSGAPYIDPARNEAQHEPLPQPPEGFKPWESLDPEWVLSRMSRNVTGDAELFAAMHQGRITFNLSTGGDRKVVETLVFLFAKDGTGLHWTQDEAGSYAHNQVESVAKAYEWAHQTLNVVPLMDRIGQENEKALDQSLSKEDRGRHADTAAQLRKVLDTKSAAVAKRCSSIRAPSRESAILTKCTSVDGFKMNTRSLWLDAHPWLLPVANGVIDLQTGRLRPGAPEDWMIRSCPVPWEGRDFDREPLERFLREVYADPETGEPRDDLIEFNQRLVGCAIIGAVIEHKLPVFIGRGRNGKSVFMNILGRTLGPLAGIVAPELLLDSGNLRSADAPTPSVMGLKGLRLAAGSEVSEGRRFGIDAVQRLTGGDKLTGRHPNDKYPIQFDPTHMLFLLTNNLPDVPGQAYAFWERVLVIRHDVSFVSREPREKWEKRANPNRLNDLLGCLPGILAWMVDGCAAYMRWGLRPPPIVLKDTEEYRGGEDELGEFLEACCTKAGHQEESAAQLYETFTWWWKDSGRKLKYLPSQKRVGKWMKEKGFENHKKGTVYWRGLSVRDEIRDKRVNVDD